MKKVSIIYGSTTGNTKKAANIIKDLLDGYEVSVVEVSNANPSDVEAADMVVYGSSTWGYGDMQDDFEVYYNKMDQGLIENRQFAVFGCGDSVSFSDVFCEAVTQISEKVETLGGKTPIEALRIDGDVVANMPNIESFVGGIKKVLA